MTRINTNVSSLIAQKTLARSNAQLQQALTRLSTGLRINVGKDDPAGLIASEALRSDIISVEKAITNSERANQLIATADSALGQVSQLLNDIRGLVTEAANKGALSDDQVDANQLQIDSSLEAIDRIAQITSFQGRRLLDGNLDFITSGVSSKIRGLQIDQANFGTLSQIGVDINVVKQATQAELNYQFGAIATATVLEVAGSNGTEAFQFAAGSTIDEIATAVNLVSDATGVTATVQEGATAGVLTASSFGQNNDVTITAKNAGEDAGDIRVKYSEGGTTATTVDFTAAQSGSPATLDVQLKTRAYVAAAATVDDTDTAQTAVYAINNVGANNDLVLTATAAGNEASGITVNINAAALPAATAYVAGTKTLTLGVNGVADANATVAALTAILATILPSGEGFTIALAATDATSGTNSGAVANATETNVGSETTQGIGADNNALEFTATVAGSKFNDVDVNFVDDDLLLASAGLAAGSEVITYNDDAQAASAALTFSGANNDLVISAATKGKAFNGVKVLLTNSGSLAGNSAAVTYNSTSKTLTIDIVGGTTTAATIVTALATEGTFTGALDTSVEGANTGLGTVAAADAITRGGRVGSTGNSGGDAGTLYIKVEHGLSTANNVVTAFSAAGNAKAAALFTVARRVDNDGTGVISTEAKVDTFAGGVTGGDIVATATEVVTAINGNAAASAVLTAALTGTDNGLGVATEFQEFAYSGAAESNNRLQFLGPADSRNIRYVSVAGQALSVDLSTDPEVTARSKATLTATNAQASLVFEAVSNGKQFDGTQIRFIANNGTSANTVVYDGEESRAFANLRFINTGANSGIQITAATRGEDFNDVNVILADTGAVTGNNATVVYDATAKTLTIDIDGGTTTANTILAAVNTEGTFSAALNRAGDAGNTGAGVILATDLSATFADTGSTGGEAHTLTFTVANATTAAQIVTLLSGDSYAKKFFFANNFGNSAGTGAIDFFGDDARGVSSGGIASEGTLIVNLGTDSNGLVTTAANDLIEYFNDTANVATLSALGISVSNSEGSDGTGLLEATTADIAFQGTGTTQTNANSSLTTDAVNGLNAAVQVDALQSGTAYDGVTLVFENNPLLTGGGDETVAYDTLTKVLTVRINQNTSTAADVVNAINNVANGVSTLFSAVVVAGAGVGLVSVFDTGTSTGGVVTSGEPTGAALLGNEDQVATGLTFKSGNFGSDQFVSVKALSGSFVVTNIDDDDSTRASGTDVTARVNGIQAVGNGLSASINTSSLDLNFTIDSAVLDGEALAFLITGGGALFQLGPDVVSNQQARLGIQSVSSATLGGVNGRLFELRSGGAKAVNSDAGAAAKVVDEVITSVTKLRGRLGAFQRTTLETNIFTLNDTLANLTDAESSIRDADFAAESARLTRAQILVQSGTSVLQIANQNPQNVLALLR